MSDQINDTISRVVRTLTSMFAGVIFVAGDVTSSVLTMAMVISLTYFRAKRKSEKESE